MDQVGVRPLSRPRFWGAPGRRASQDAGRSLPRCAPRGAAAGELVPQNASRNRLALALLVGGDQRAELLGAASCFREDLDRPQDLRERVMSRRSPTVWRGSVASGCCALVALFLAR